MERKAYTKKLNASLNSPVLHVVLENDAVIEEWVAVPMGNYRDSGAPWGMIGKNEGEVIAEGFQFSQSITDYWNRSEDLGDERAQRPQA